MTENKLNYRNYQQFYSVFHAQKRRILRPSPAVAKPNQYRSFLESQKDPSLRTFYPQQSTNNFRRVRKPLSEHKGFYANKTWNKKHVGARATKTRKENGITISKGTRGGNLPLTDGGRALFTCLGNENIPPDNSDDDDFVNPPPKIIRKEVVIVNNRQPDRTITKNTDKSTTQTWLDNAATNSRASKVKQGNVKKGLLANHKIQNTPAKFPLNIKNEDNLTHIPLKTDATVGVDKGIIKELERFDLNRAYGACLNITRKQRLYRALKYNLKPTPSFAVINFLEDIPDNSPYNNSVLHGH